MPSSLELITVEKIASMIFIISSFQALFSACKAEKSELEKQQNSETSPEYQASIRNTNQLALDSTIVGTLGFLLFLIVAIIRKNQLELEIYTGKSSISICPSISIVFGLFVSVLGNSTRVPAIQQRLEESIRPVIL